MIRALVRALAAVLMLALRAGAAEDVWFRDLGDASALEAREVKAWVRWAATGLAPGGAADDRDLPAALQEGRRPRLVFLSVSDGTRPARIVAGGGPGIQAAIRQAVSRVPEPGQAGWVKLDIVRDATPVKAAPRAAPVVSRRGLDGAALDRESGIALLPDEILARELADDAGRLKPERIATYLESTGRPANAFRQGPAFRFRTDSAFWDGEQAYRLYRGHRAEHPVTAQSVLRAARLAGDYLRRMVRDDGSFVYAYEAARDTVPRRYNILRHAGTIYAMMELYEVARDAELLAAAERAIGYLLDQAKTVQAGEHEFLCIEERGYVKLGGNGLAVVALAKHAAATGERRHLDTMQRLCDWIAVTQEANGRFAVHKLRVRDLTIMDFVSTYYPGEALLALVRLHALDGEERWLDAAERGAHYLITVRDRGRGLDRLPHDHWLLYALNDLYRLRPKPLYLQQALRIAQAVLARQNRGPQEPDWRGSYYRPPRSTPTATRSEALYAAWQLARDFAGDDITARILEGLKLGVGFQLHTQLRPASVLYLPRPDRCLGAFRRSLTDFEARIDYTQHNLSSLLGLYRILSTTPSTGNQRDAPR
jgi:hypothetical protein